MTDANLKIDRYLSFDGLDCDQRARELITLVRQQIAQLGQGSPWADYFATKLAESERRGHDELHFVGSQVNALRELFVLTDHARGNALLEGLEEQCC